MTTPYLHSALERAAHHFGDRTALVRDDEEWSFARLQAAADAMSGRLAAFGVGPGDRVAVMMGCRPEFVVAVHAISRLGAAAVLISPSWKTREVGAAVALTVPVHAVGEATTLPVLAESLGETAVTDVDGPPDPRPAAAAPTGAPDGEGDALLVFSSGTTGLPKAARHTHRTIGAAIGHWRRALGLSDRDRFQVATPPTHILGLLNLLTAIDAGASVRMHARFDLDEILSRIGSERMTLEMAVAPIALAMANHPRLEDFDLSSLRYIMWGATPVTPSVAETVTARTGARWLAAYGATELPVIAANPIDDPSAWRLDSAGLAIPGVELRVVDLETGRKLAPGQTGEIQARSPSLMTGYLPEEANREAFVDGWYRTGDVGWLEAEGWVHLTDRSKEMIKVKGFQVAPAEIEAVLLGHPDVVDCAVFGIPDAAAGEVPVAAVQLAPTSGCAPSDLQDLVAATLAGYKRLGHVVVVETVPRLASGKALRRQLRDEWAPRLAGGLATS